MENDLLTLTREIQILRDENLKQKEQIAKHRQHAADSKKYSKLMNKMAHQLRYMSNGHNEKIAERCKLLVEELDSLKAEIKAQYN